MQYSSTQRGTILSANHVVNRLPKYADIAVLQISWFSDCVCEEVWYTNVNSTCIWFKTDQKSIRFENNWIPMRR